MHWYDKAVERLENDLDDGLISNEEFREEMRQLNWELREQAEITAEEAYDDVTGNW